MKHLKPEQVVAHIRRGESPPLEADSVSAEELESARRVVGALKAIGESEAPSLSWDQVGARVHWQLSLERRSGGRPAAKWRRPLAGTLLLGAAAAGFVAWLVLSPVHDSPERTVAVDGMAPSVSAAAVSKPRAEIGLVVLAQGEVRREGAESNIFDRPVVEGSHLATKDGLLAVQFEREAGFRLAPASSAFLSRFDADLIEVDLDGTIDVDISHRPPGQRFVIAAGAVRIEVRGTRFRVDYQNGHLSVTCTRGIVVVSSAGGGRELSVVAGERLDLERVLDSAARARSLDENERESMDRDLSIPMLPSWNEDWDGTRPHGAALVAVEGVGPGPVEIDGTVVGLSPVRALVLPGRHLVTDGVGQDRWVDFSTGERRVFRPVERAPRRKRKAAGRASLLIESIASASAVQRCVDRLRKRDLAQGAFLEFEIGVARDGAQRYLNLIDSDLPKVMQRCVLNAIDRLDMSQVGPASARHRLDF